MIFPYASSPQTGRSYKLFKRKDESTFSICVWSNGVDTLLPKADNIAFIVNHEKKDQLRVPWEGTFPVVSGLMELEPDLDPIRYRVRRFPDETQVNLLRQCARLTEI